ncbi:hypothetical protein M422DRAFT_48693 [Sphaerobolus stellatus SS14]|uniref:Uncharacterized protein n=1 Tax=Sphaerobolus stellatus (strain SS14) TaxID=990650 RepID=A0A0C9V2F8_SPHS4|nr:hypothetical protein M422DRAFT_48693 [Sphaerobolus stellatus SS14]
MIKTLAKADHSKPQPFRLMRNKIEANSVLLEHPILLDNVYVDSAGFLFNIQDEDGIDCLQIDYTSVISIRFTDDPKVPQDTVQVTLALSSPPIKADQTIPPTANGNRVSFIIATADKPRFLVTIGNRGLSSKVKGTTTSKAKNSVVASGPLDLNSFPQASVEHFPAYSIYFDRTNPRRSHPRVQSTLLAALKIVRVCSRNLLMKGFML